MAVDAFVGFDYDDAFQVNGSNRCVTIPIIPLIFTITR